MYGERDFTHMLTPAHIKTHEREKKGSNMSIIDEPR